MYECSMPETLVTLKVNFLLWGGSQSLVQQLTAHRSTVTQMSSLIVKSSMEMQTADKCKERLNMCIEKLD